MQESVYSGSKLLRAFPPRRKLEVLAAYLLTCPCSPVVLIRRGTSKKVPVVCHCLGSAPHPGHGKLCSQWLQNQLKTWYRMYLQSRKLAQNVGS